MITYIRARRAAKRMGLRYRGMTESYWDMNTVKYRYHPGCCTRLRVGIDITGQAFSYCWRCEQVYENLSRVVTHNEPKRLPAPSTNVAAVVDGVKVLRFPATNKSPPPTAS